MPRTNSLTCKSDETLLLHCHQPFSRESTIPGPEMRQHCTPHSYQTLLLQPLSMQFTLGSTPFCHLKKEALEAPHFCFPNAEMGLFVGLLAAARGPSSWALGQQQGSGMVLSGACCGLLSSEELWSTLHPPVPAGQPLHGWRQTGTPERWIGS